MTENDEIKIDEATLRELTESAVVSRLITYDKLYIDLALLFDFYIGNLLSFLVIPDPDMPLALEPKEAYKYIINQWPVYSAREFIDLPVFFPSLNLKNEILNNRLHDPEASNLIFKCSPATQFISVLSAQLAVNVNHSKVIGKTDNITLTVNTYPLVLSDINKASLGYYLSNGLGVTIKLINCNPTSLNINDLLNYEELYCFYLKEMMDNENIRKLFSELRMVKKRIYAPRFFGYTYEHKNTNQETALVTAALNIGCIFKYVDMASVTSIVPKSESSSNNLK